MPTKPKDEWQELKPKTAEFNKVGDYHVGVLVDRKVIDDKMSSTPGAKVVIYTLLNDEGEALTIWGKRGHPKVIPGLEQAHMGEYVKVAFDKEVPAKTKGFAPAKVFKVYTKGEMKPEVLKAYRFGKLGEVQEDPEVPFEDENPSM